jgi:hypothetical protein
MGDNNTSVPAPFVFAPSQAFHGNDGRWSSFIVRIGTPEQNFAILPSTAGHETIIPMPEGCTADDPTNCAELRGVYPFNGETATGFQTNASSTWNSIGLYTLDLGDRLGLDGNGLYGLEKVGLQLQNSNGLTLDGQVVAGIATKNHYIGSFGLGPKPSNFSTYDNPVPSFMRTLRDKRMVPSLSYGYTAGAAYAIPQRYGSLTLGGYDASRFVDNTQTFPFNKDDSIVLSPGLQKITATSTLLGTRSFLNSAILAVIDSTLPYIWLPRESCDSFAEAFGLTFDEATELYIVNDTIHKQLQSLKPSVTFSLGNDANPANLINIILPYAALDLQASDPIFPNATNYFPIRRAANEAQYTLGRAFLQEAYVVADYERSNFSVYQTASGGSSVEQRIVTIHAPSEKNSTGSTPQSDNSSTGLGTSAIIGIAVGAAVLVLALAIGGFIWYRRRRGRPTVHEAPSGEATYWQPPPEELPTEQKHEMYQQPSEAGGVKIGYELPAKDAHHELPAKNAHHLLSDDSAHVVGAPDGIYLTHELPTSGHGSDAKYNQATELDAHKTNVTRP